VLRDVFEYVACKRIVDRTVVDLLQLPKVADNRLNAGFKKPRKISPKIDRDAAPRYNVVDEMTASTANVQHTAIRWHHPAEMMVP
jgi:hypothetical protein